MKDLFTSIRSKLLALIGFFLAVIAAVAVWGNASSWSSLLAFDEGSRASVGQERAIHLMVIDFKEQVQEWKNVLLRGKNPEALEKYWNAFSAKERQIQANGKSLAAQVANPESRKLLNDFLSAHVKMGEGYRRGLQAFKDSGFEAGAADAVVKGADREPTQLLEQSAETVSKDTGVAFASMLESAKRSAVFSAAAFAVTCLMLVIVLVFFVTRTVVRPLQEAVRVADRLARGDFSVEIGAPGRDEIGRLMGSLQHTVGQLSKMVRQVKVSSEVIGVSTAQLATGNSDLSQRTEEQASSLEETASSMEELTSTVRQNAQNAQQANQLAAGTSAMAVKGGEVVAQVVNSMSSINESSKKIADIIGVIDGIAFQTNILALNAAVEAARAGDQGRGFAVVASEVRTLAQRSAAAAKEIKVLITDSVSKVENGTQLVDQAGKTMEEIVTSVKRVTDIMAEIAAASHEQTSGIEQVNQAVVQMDQVTQQNAALVEEAAAAAESMQQQAQSLTQAVSIFKLAANRGDAPHAHMPVERPASWVSGKGPQSAYRKAA